MVPSPVALGSGGNNHDNQSEENEPGSSHSGKTAGQAVKWGVSAALHSNVQILANQTNLSLLHDNLSSDPRNTLHNNTF